MLFRKQAYLIRGFVIAHADKPLGALILKKLTFINEILAKDKIYKQIGNCELKETTSCNENGVFHLQRHRHW